MKILIVSFFDDNYGDILIRVCFENILKVVLKNLKVNLDKCEIKRMHLKDIHCDWIENSDLIFFAGGGLFGLSYLNFYEYLNEIVNIAEIKSIPVIFSSMGINNMDANEETEMVFKKLLKNKCIKAVSVRENLELFQKYAGHNNSFKVKLVCDPAVWSKYVYYNELPQKEENRKKVVGINVVRGGLFKDNKKDWKLKDEFNYLYNLKELLES